MTADSAAIAATAGGSLMPLAILLPALGVLLSLLLGGRQAERIALGLMPVAIGRRPRHRRARVALRPTTRLYARRLCAAARHRAQSRRVFGRHARDGRADHAGRRPVRPGQFRDAAGERKSARRSPSGLCCRACRRRSACCSWAEICSISMSGSSF